MFYSAGSSSGIAVFLTLDKAPVAGEPIRFTVNAVNKQKVAKVMKVHFNAQAKEYNHSPSETFWETHGIIEMSPMECKFTPRLHISASENATKVFNVCPPLSAAKVIKQRIFPAQYEDVVGDDLINLAVVLEDMATQERVLATEEFNITSAQLTIQVNTLSYSLIIIICELRS